MKFARIHPIMCMDIAKEWIKVHGPTNNVGVVQYLCQSLLMQFGRIAVIAFNNKLVYLMIIRGFSTLVVFVHSQ